MSEGTEAGAFGNEPSWVISCSKVMRSDLITRIIANRSRKVSKLSSRILSVA